MDKATFWKNWSATRNGCAWNIEFFANNFTHAENALRACGEFMPPYPAKLDAWVKPAAGGGYIAGFIAPLHLGQELRQYMRDVRPLTAPDQPTSAA